VEEAIRRHPSVRGAERMADAAASCDPMSGIAVMVTQDPPFPGKSSRRAAAASASADVPRADARVTAVDIHLVLARDELVLLAKRESPWAESEGAARSRYEAG
jgi:hypothetical protein